MAARKQKYPSQVSERDKEAGEAIRGLRQQKRLSQSDLAREIAIDRTTYNRKENGKIGFTVGEFIYLKDFLNQQPTKIKHTPIAKLLKT